MGGSEALEDFLQSLLVGDSYSFGLLREAFDERTKIGLEDVKRGEKITWCVPLSKDILGIPVNKEFVAEVGEILPRSEFPRRVELCRLESNEHERPGVFMAIFPEGIKGRTSN